MSRCTGSRAAENINSLSAINRGRKIIGKTNITFYGSMSVLKKTLQTWQAKWRNGGQTSHHRLISSTTWLRQRRFFRCRRKSRDVPVWRSVALNCEGTLVHFDEVKVQVHGTSKTTVRHSLDSAEKHQESLGYLFCILKGTGSSLKQLDDSSTIIQFHSTSTLQVV